MKLILLLSAVVIICGLLLSSCKSTKSTPTPFKVSTKKIIAPGCVQLHKDVEEWNNQHPDKEPRIADC